MTSRLSVGIDLGTSHTVVAWAEPSDGAVHDLQLSRLEAPGRSAASALLPSVLYCPAPAEGVVDPWTPAPWSVGSWARQRAREVPRRGIVSPKSWLCHPGIDRLAPVLPWSAPDSPDLTRLSPVDASAHILGHVAAAFADAMPGRRLAEQDLVLTVPAAFDQVARELTVLAATRAGLHVRLLEEPQAAFHAWLAAHSEAELQALVAEHDPAHVLVCDVGGGTTDLTLIRATRTQQGVALARVAVGRHLLLGGDNMDLALAHLAESRLGAPDSRLDAADLASLTLACRSAKEQLLGTEPPAEVPVVLAARGSQLVGATRRASLSRDEVWALVLDGFFPLVERAARPGRARAGLSAVGLPYERDSAITRHLAEFLVRHDVPRVDHLLLVGGVFRASAIRARILEQCAAWYGAAPNVLVGADPDLAVARGAVGHALARLGRGPRIAGGSAHSYFVGVDAEGARALCVVPRGAEESIPYVTAAPELTLALGREARFLAFASATGAHAPGDLVDAADLDPLPAIHARFPGTPGATVRVRLAGELSPAGVLQLSCREVTGPGSLGPSHQLAFELRRPDVAPEEAVAKAPRASHAPPSLAPSRRGASALEGAGQAIERVFGKVRKDVASREIKDLLRELERLLGERATWNLATTRALCDALLPLTGARRRSPDHERVFWLLAGYCLRPGFGHARDAGRASSLAPSLLEPLAFPLEARSWEQLWIATRRVAGGLDEAVQTTLRERIDPFLAPDELKLKKPKGYRPLAPDELLRAASFLERVPSERRAELGRWTLERTWTRRDPALWEAVGRLGARVPAYGSAHQVVAPRVVERWIEHLLREKWAEMPSAPRAALSLARATGDRARDLSPGVREEVAKELVRNGAPELWARSVREVVPFDAGEQRGVWGDDLPAGLMLDIG